MNRSKIWALAAIIMIVFGYPAFPEPLKNKAAGKSAQSSGKAGTARTSYKFFSIEFPKNWNVKQKDSGNTVIAKNLAGPYMMAWIEDLSKPMNAEEYFQDRWADMQRDLEFLGESEIGKSTIDGAEAKWAVFSQMIAGRKHRILQYWIVGNSRGFNVSGAAEPARFNEFKSQFESAAQSFKIAGSSRR